MVNSEVGAFTEDHCAQLSTELYKNITPGQQITDAYYHKYIAVIRKRVDQAGIRLAGVLNNIYASESVKGRPEEPPVVEHVAKEKTVQVPLSEVGKYVDGQTLNVSGKVYGSKDIGRMLLVNLGAAYPNQLLTVAIKGKAKQVYTKLDDKTIAVTGKVILFKGKPEIVVTDPADLQVK